MDKSSKPHNFTGKYRLANIVMSGLSEEDKLNLLEPGEYEAYKREEKRVLAKVKTVRENPNYYKEYTFFHFIMLGTTDEQALEILGPEEFKKFKSYEASFNEEMKEAPQKSNALSNTIKD